MAELNVQPKKQISILPWILLLLGVAALIWALARNKNNEATTTAATTISDSGSNKSISNNTAAANWTDVNFDAPAMNYEEVTNKEISVRGNNSYGIYGIGENILFDEGSTTLRPDAEDNLKQIVSSIDKRYQGSEVRLYGFTDATGSTGSNKDLAQKRADAVKEWLQKNGIEEGRISVSAIGEAQPVATNSTEAGRQQNRRVEIVARNGSSSDTK